jgi:hypothetical protein
VKRSEKFVLNKREAAHAPSARQQALMNFE